MIKYTVTLVGERTSWMYVVDAADPRSAVTQVMERSGVDKKLVLKTDVKEYVQKKLCLKDAAQDALFLLMEILEKNEVKDSKLRECMETLRHALEDARAED